MEKITEYKEKFFVPEIVEEQKIPWVTEEQINAPTSVKNIPWWTKTYWSSYNVWWATAPYDIVFSNIPFKPSLINITANYPSWHSVISWGTASEWNKWNCVFQHDNNNKVVSWVSYVTNKIIELQWYESNTNYNIGVELKSMDDNGFTLSVTRNDWEKGFQFNYSCIW